LNTRYKRLRDCNIATRSPGVRIEASKNATTTTTFRTDATQPPSVTFRATHFVSVYCGQRVQNLCFRLCASHGRLEEHVFAPQFQGKTASRLWIVWLRSIFFSYPIFSFFFLLLLSFYLFSATSDVTAMSFLTFTFVTCRDIIFFLSKLHLFCLSLLSSRPCEDQLLPPDATNAWTYRHFPENHLKFFPLAETKIVY
jgi:hypothetical protein